MVIVCICANVSDRAIAEAVRNGCGSVDEITLQTGAGAGCGQCRRHCQSEVDMRNTLLQVSELSRQTV